SGGHHSGGPGVCAAGCEGDSALRDGVHRESCASRIQSSRGAKTTFASDAV
ncbi:unnamed protein product, partial [Polarella glacialis]